MLRTLVAGVGLFALTLTTGCEGAKKAASDAKDAASKAAAAAKDAVEAAKTAVAKTINDGLPKIEEKINGLSGDAKTKAQEKFDELKKSLAEFKTTAPDKWEALKAKATQQFEELKKMVGLEK